MSGKLGKGRDRTYNIISIIFLVLAMLVACWVIFQLVAGV